MNKQQIKNALDNLILQGCGSIQGKENFNNIVELAEKNSIKIERTVYPNNLYWLYLDSK